MQHIVNTAPMQTARDCSGVTNIWKGNDNTERICIYMHTDNVIIATT